MSSSCLWNPNFLAMIIYGCLTLPVSALIIWTIASRRKSFKGTFYRIYVVISIHEMIMYFVKYPIIRLPLFTGLSCPLAPFFESGRFTGLDLIHFLHWHVGFTVLLLESTIAFDRLVIILLGARWKKIWRDSYVYFIVFAIFFPLIFSHVVLRDTSVYQYFVDTDNYQIMTSEQYRSYLYNGAIGMLLVCTCASLVMNSTVLFSFCSGRLQIGSIQKKTEFKLFIYSLVELISEILMIIVFILQRFTPLDSPLYNFSRYFLLFTQDAVTLLPPFILLATSAQLRQAIREMIFGKKPTPVTNYSFTSKK